MWRGHLGKIAEASDDRLQVGNFCQQGFSALLEDLFKLAGVARFGAQHVFHGNLQGKQRIFQLMGETPRQFAPGGHTLALQQALALLQKLARHAVEGVGQASDFIVGGVIHFDAEVAG